MAVQGTYFGNYLLLAKLARGGMAEVYIAKSFGAEGFERLLAIKKMLAKVSRDEQFVKMFIDEANIASRLTHANIAQIYELGKKESTLFIAMEFVHGRDLYHIIERARGQGQAVPPRLAASIIARVAEGLDYAHRKADEAGRPLGIVHRDISPQNVLLSFEGDVKLIDFGIAKARDKMAQTQAGVIKGKFVYMAPEQISDQPLDPGTDIFALGAVLYEALSGRQAFRGPSDVETFRNVAQVRYTPLAEVAPEVPRPLAAIVERCLQKERERRYGRAAELSADLQRYLLADASPPTAEDLGGYLRQLFASEFEDEQKKLIFFKSVKPPPRDDAAEVPDLEKTVIAGTPRPTGRPAAIDASALGATRRRTSDPTPLPPTMPAARVPDVASEQGPVILADELVRRPPRRTGPGYGVAYPSGMAPAGYGSGNQAPVDWERALGGPPRRKRWPWVLAGTLAVLAIGAAVLTLLRPELLARLLAP